MDEESARTESQPTVAAARPMQPVATIPAPVQLPESRNGHANGEKLHTDDTIVVGPLARANNHAPNTAVRGRGGSRGRGKPRPSIGGAKAKKRKRRNPNGDDEDSEAYSSDEVCTPSALITKSGRSIQKPSTFVPPAIASPNGTANGIKPGTESTAQVFKKKRVWRRNAENAVCKSCLRGTSPVSNVIVFCDGCNTPYHRWCHHPPIAQSVIDEPDKEWYCRGCKREQVVPVSETELADWAAAPGATAEDRQRFFMSLTPGTMITLLMRATSVHPDLNVFAPDWIAKQGSRVTQASTRPENSHAVPAPKPVQNGHSTAIDQSSRNESTIYVQHDDEDDLETYPAETHPLRYVRPGQGLMSTLPPDKDDEKHLVDEESSKGVFHHIFLVDDNASKQDVRP